MFKWYRDLKSKALEAYVLSEDIKRLKKELEESTTRLKKVEDAYTIQSGIPIRVEVTRVFAKFNKTEMCAFQAGLQRLLTNSTMGDAEYYIKLSQKVQGFIDNMDETDEQ